MTVVTDDEDDDDDDGMSIRTAIEENALQDLMVSCLHVADAKLAKSVRTVLSPLHRAKKSPDVDKLLHRMYGPILWRALSAANPTVRLNATPVLAETFPLRDPDEGEDRTEAVVGKTVDALMALLRDPEPKVRVAGSNAAGRILVAFWDALPTSDIRRLLSGKFNLLFVVVSGSRFFFVHNPNLSSVDLYLYHKPTQRSLPSTHRMHRRRPFGPRLLPLLAS